MLKALLLWTALAATVCLATAPAAHAANPEPDPCARPAPGSLIEAPPELRSEHGVLNVEFHMRNHRQPDGRMRYCYVLPDGGQAPTLRLHPGDLLVLQLHNELKDADVAPHAHHHAPAQAAAPRDPCTSGMMSLTSTNLHFHGLTVPPVCHQDDVLRTSIQPNDPAFEYRFEIPANEPPGLYWYHPHIHGFSTKQVLGGASGALIIEGLENANPVVANLPERVLVIRDQDLLNPNAPPAKSEPVVPKMMIDRDGDSANNGTGFGKPAKDLSINYVTVPYPDYPPARLAMRAGGRELWRVLNASAITYLNLAVIVGHAAQPLDIVAIDGVPLNANGNAANAVERRDHIGLPPGARVEFMLDAPPAGAHAAFVTRTVDTGQGGENDPNRALALIESSAAAPQVLRLPQASGPMPKPSVAWLGDVRPVRERHLYFSEKLSDPKNPNSATDFYLTVEGETPVMFDPTSDTPNIVARHGDVEDWIIENRSTELHAFHIHQLHFLLMDWSGTPVNEPFLRDTVNVPYFSDRMLKYPSVRLRMDFRDPNTVGTFVYHCHLLEHEDGGMMGTIRIESAR